MDALVTEHLQEDTIKKGERRYLDQIQFNTKAKGLILQNEGLYKGSTTQQIQRRVHQLIQRSGKENITQFMNHHVESKKFISYLYLICEL